MFVIIFRVFYLYITIPICITILIASISLKFTCLKSIANIRRDQKSLLIDKES